MRCDNCGTPARHAPLDGGEAALCEECKRRQASAQSKLADMGGSGQTSLAGGWGE